MKRLFLMMFALLLTSNMLSAQEQNKSRMYNRTYRADMELVWHNHRTWGFATSHGYSFGNGLYVGGGAGFTAEFADYNSDPAYILPLFADVKYNFLNKKISPYLSAKAGGYADVTSIDVQGIRTFINPAIGLDFNRVSIEVGYEYQLGCWGHRNGEHIHQFKCGVGLSF